MILISLLYIPACESASSGEGNRGTGGTSGVGSGGSVASTGGTAGSGGAAGAGGVKSTGGSTSRGGGGGTTASGGAGGANGTTPGVGGAGGTTITPATGGDAGETGGSASGGRPGGAGGEGTGGVGGQTGTGGRGTGGQGGGFAVGCGPEPTCTDPAPTSTAYAVDTSGVTFNVGSGKMKVQVCQANILRVAYTGVSSLPKKDSLIVSNPWSTPTTFCVTEATGTVTITTACMKAKVSSSTGAVTYIDLSDNTILAEASKSATATTVEGTSTFKVTTSFNSPSGEALYGLGQYQNSVMNRRGTSQRLLNANTEINIPVLVSNKGYGLLWDNTSTGNFSSSGSTYSYSGESGERVDCYFFYGPSIDQVIAGYRTATGGRRCSPSGPTGYSNPRTSTAASRSCCRS